MRLCRPSPPHGLPRCDRLRALFYLPRIVRKHLQNMEVLVVCPRPHEESVAPRRTADGTNKTAAKSPIASWRLAGALRNITGIPGEIIAH